MATQFAAGPEDREALETAVLRGVRTLSEAMPQHTRAAAHHLGMSPTEVRALNVVSSHRGLTAGELGAALGVTSGGITGIVDRLERIGHLSRQPDLSDRRRVKVEVTEEAAQVAREMLSGLNREIGELLRDRSPEELLLIEGFLITLAGAVRRSARELEVGPPASRVPRPRAGASGRR
jgi:DNA-binding MarR family transcriptional regulator